MSPRGRRIVPVVVAAFLVVASIVVVVGTRRLEDHVDELDRRWMPLRPDLAVRYENLQALHDVFHDEHGGRTIARELQRLLDEWERLQRSREVDAGAEVDTANALELTARRMLAFTYRSNRLRPSPDLEQAFVTFTRSLLPSPELPRYNREAAAYEQARDSVIGVPAAHLLGFYGRARLGLTL